MDFCRAQWLHRWNPLRIGPSLPRSPSQKLIYVYFAAFLACAYVFYMFAIPTSATADFAVVWGGEVCLPAREKLPLIAAMGDDESLGQNNCTQIRDIGLDGGAKDETLLSTSEFKTILLWNSFFGESNYIPPLTDMCPGYPCRVTSNRSEKAEAVIVHLRDIDVADVPKRASRNQIFALLNAEAPPYSPPIADAFNGIFNWTITYRLDADIPLVKSVDYVYRHNKSNQKDYHANKTKMAAWFVSHCSTSSQRETLVSELAKHGVPTDIVGGCGNFECPRDNSQKCFSEFSKNYLFYLSFENSICIDYVTEKLFNALHFGEMVPVVLGGANYAKMAPPGSYINVKNFRSIKELALYLQKVAKDPKLYNSYHRWRNYYEVREPLHYACRLCAKLHTMYSHRTYQDFNKYWHMNTCFDNWSRAFRL